MRVRVLTLAVAAVLAFAAPPPASTAPKRLPAQLGFILFCTTSMTDVTARLGPGRRFHDGVFVWRGWYDLTARVYLLIAGWEGRGPKGTPLLFQAWLASESHKNSALDDVRLKAAHLGRPRLSSPRCEGRKG